MLWEGNGSKREQMRRDIQRKISQINMERRELELPHNPYDQEQREFLSIEQGDREALKKALAEKRTGTMTGKLADDPLRSAKNIGIVILTLASRAAIRGGMNPETSFTIERTPMHSKSRSCRRKRKSTEWRERRSSTTPLRWQNCGRPGAMTT